MKYSWEFKLECVNKYKNGEHINISGSPGFHHSFMQHVRDWAAAYDELGVDGLKHSPTSKNRTPEERFELVAKVLAGNPIASVAKNAHINSGQLYRWVRRYNGKGMDGLQCKKGRPAKRFAMKKKTKKTKLSVSEQEELKLLRERNEYLEMENEYLKNSMPWSQRGKPRKPRRKSKSDWRAVIHSQEMEALQIAQSGFSSKSDILFRAQQA